MAKLEGDETNENSQMQDLQIVQDASSPREVNRACDREASGEAYYEMSSARGRFSGTKSDYSTCKPEVTVVCTLTSDISLSGTYKSDKMMKTVMLLIVLVSLTITTARFLDESVSVLPIINDLFPGVCVVVCKVAWSRAERARFSVQF